MRPESNLNEERRNSVINKATLAMSEWPCEVLFSYEAPVDGDGERAVPYSALSVKCCALLSIIRRIEADPNLELIQVRE